MQSAAKTIEKYIAEVPADKQEAFNKLHQTILKHLPKGLEACMNYGMIGYVVPKSIYPNGYHCDTSLPLPFMALAAQKNSINFYHMGMYLDPTILEWFQTSYAKTVPGKLDMGKSCVRFKKADQIPHELIGKLVAKMSVKQWITIYEKNLNR